MEVSEFHSGSRQGAIRIPEGEAKQGWVEFSRLCKGFWDPNHHTMPFTGGGNLPRPVNGEMGTRMAREENMPKISHANQNPNHHVTAAVKSALGDVQKNHTGVNSHVNLEIKLELGFGLDGLWNVYKAEVVQVNPTKPLGPPKNQQAQQSRPMTSSRPTQIWRPKLKPMGPLTKPIDCSGGSTHADGSSSTGQDPCVVDKTTQQLSVAETKEKEDLRPSVEPRVEIFAPLAGEGDDRLWGSPSAWMLELRDGRRVSIPLSLLRTPESKMSKEPRAEDAIVPHGGGGVGSDLGDSLNCAGLEDWGEADSDEDDVSVVWEDTYLPGGDGNLLCWEGENSPLEVAPLAMAVP
jgi:hypothetical protein